MLCAVCVGGMFASCGAKSDMQSVKDAGKLVVGITEYAPMDYKDENDNWTGFDAEFARLFADKLGVTAEFIVIDWDNKLFELSSGAIDCIIAGMSPTAEREEQVDFTDCYYNSNLVVIIKK